MARLSFKTITTVDKATLNVIFDTHSKFLEQRNVGFSFKMPIPLGEIEGIDSMQSIMQHSYSQSNA